MNRKFGLAGQKRRFLHNHFGGKNVWIVGGSSGIGLELVQQLTSYGANVIVSSRRSVLLPSSSSSSSSSSSTNEDDVGGNVLFVPLDITGSIDELNQAIDSVQTILTSNDNGDGNTGSNKLDYIILNAGRGQLSTADDTTYDTTKEIFQVNTLGPIAITQLLLQRGILSGQPNEPRPVEELGTTTAATTTSTKKNMKERPTKCCNHFMVTSSVGAKFGVPLSSSYAASKHALHGYYRSLHAENPSLKIDLICPGPISTPFHSTDHVKETEIDSNSDNTNKTKKRDLKMDVKRCAALMISSMMMNHHSRTGGYCKERWITEQPTLLGLYINQYVPTLFQNFMLSKIGPLRVKAFQQGKNLYDPDTWTKK